MSHRQACTVHRLSSADPLFDAYCRLRIALWPGCAPDCSSEAENQLSGPSAGAVFLALDKQSQPIGFIELSLRSVAESATISPVPFIEGWFVAATHRRQGIGRALVENRRGLGPHSWVYRDCFRYSTGKQRQHRRSPALGLSGGRTQCLFPEAALVALL